jgi:predicted GIY-YIG superfamily endonuclease
MYNLYYLKSNLDSRIYIGITKYPEKRHKDHLRYSIKESHYNGNWIRKTIERGGTIDMKILVSNISRETAIKLEIETIKLFRKLKIEITNTADGGLGFNHKGIPHSEEHKKAIEQAQPHKVRLPKDELFDLYVNQKLSKKTISKIYECGITTIDRRLKEYNIPIRVTENYKASYKLDREEILDLYLNKKKSMLELSRIYGIGCSGIRTFLNRENIKTGINKTANLKNKKRLYDNQFILSFKEMVDNGLSLIEISKKLNITKSKVTYIKHRYLDKVEKTEYKFNFDEIKEMYMIKKMTKSEIASFYDVSVNVITNYLKNNSLKRGGNKINRDILYDLYIKDNMTAKKVSKVLNMNYSYICELVCKFKLKELKLLNMHKN